MAGLCCFRRERDSLRASARATKGSNPRARISVQIRKPAQKQAFRGENGIRSELTARVTEGSNPRVRISVQARKPAQKQAFCGENGIRSEPTARATKGSNPRVRISVQARKPAQKQAFCGENGIRTRETLWRFTRFPGVPLQPLEHLSKKGAFQPLKCVLKQFFRRQR